MKTKKKCPKCGFKECHHSAPVCEKCDYDFRKQRKVRMSKVKVIIDDDDTDNPVEPVKQSEPPKETNKVCPDCGYKCYWRSPLCEKCDYNFRTQESAKKSTDSIKKEEETTTEEKRTYLGIVPFSECFKGKPQAWMLYNGDASDTSAIRTWVATFRENLLAKFPGEEIHPYAAAYFADSRKELEPIKDKLSRAITGSAHWIPDCKAKCYRVWTGISEDTRSLFQSLNRWCNNETAKAS